jgi:putative ATP-binding cassette transporter
MLPAILDAWRLARPYFWSDERWSARGLLAVILALNLIVVYMTVVFTYWYKVAYNALQTKDAPAFWASMFTYRVVPGFPYVVPGFAEIATIAILAGVYAYYLSQMLQIRWRRWMTLRFIDDWLTHRVYYQLSLSALAGTSVDNPDQRIADDIMIFVQSNLTLGVSLVSNAVTIGSLTGVLWTIGPALHVGTVTIHGYLVLAALLYSIAGTYFTQLIGHPLVPLTFQQQQFQANFRFNLVRVRENSEQIALYSGESEEAKGLATRFQDVYSNWWRIMNRTKALNFFTIGFAQIAAIFPIVIAAPNYFTGAFTLGILMQIVTIFSNVQNALSWFVNVYPDLVSWRATVQRLDGFERAVRDAHRRERSREFVMEAGDGSLQLDDVSISLPTGESLLREKYLEITHGDPLAVAGPSGAGKSTLFRTIAGIWPYVRGRMVRPRGTMMFLPQRPYVPLGTLKHAVVYPKREEEVADAVVTGVLAEVGLGRLAHELQRVDNWMLRLSGGEQQRLALARVLVVRPDWIFLDEALSAVEESAASELFRLLRARLPFAQIVSITHHAAIEALHPRKIVVRERAEPRQGVTMICSDPVPPG